MLTPEEALAKVRRATAGLRISSVHWEEDAHGRGVVVEAVLEPGSVTKYCATTVDQIAAQSEEDLRMFYTVVVTRTWEAHARDLAAQETLIT
jgi:hypothetical protein